MAVRYSRFKGALAGKYTLHDGNIYFLDDNRPGDPIFSSGRLDKGVPRAGRHRKLSEPRVYLSLLPNFELSNRRSQARLAKGTTRQE